MPNERILVVEDDRSIATSLVRALTSQGYLPIAVGTGQAALAHVASRRVDLVLLDLGLPDIDGLDVCRALCVHDPLLPILMLTARQEEVDVVVGLGAGAVDYIAKPFGLAELLARVRAQLRRTDHDASASEFRSGSVRVDVASRRAWLGDDELDLRAKEFDLLVRLIRDAGRVVTRETLMTDVWDEHWFGSTKTLDVHISSLRRKLGDELEQPTRITTLRGVGYRYELP